MQRIPDLEKLEYVNKVLANPDSYLLGNAAAVLDISIADFNSAEPYLPIVGIATDYTIGQDAEGHQFRRGKNVYVIICKAEKVTLSKMPKVSKEKQQ